MRAHPTRKNDEIQFLRVIAVLLVLAQHLGLVMPEAHATAYTVAFWYVTPSIGVDLFFVISGYLMGKTFLSRNEGCVDVVSATFEFWRRRFWRLFPAAFFWITASSIYVALWPSPHWPTLQQMVLKWGASMLSVREFEEYARPSQLGYYWSLSIENKFYLLLPLFWFGLPRTWFWRLIIVLAIVCALYRPGGGSWWLFRFDGLLWGLLTYLVVWSDAVRRYMDSTIGISAWRAAFAFLLGLAAALTLPNALQPFHPLAYAIVGIVSAVAVGLASFNRGFMPMPRLMRGPSHWIGELSYSIYLCHIPVWMIISDILVRFSLDSLNLAARIAIGVASVLVCSTFSYWLLERPFLGQEHSRRSLDDGPVHTRAAAYRRAAE